MFPLLLTPFLSSLSLSLSLSLLLTIPPTQAENSLLYNIQSPQNGSFLRASTLNSTTSKVGIIGNPGQATSMYISDVQNINNATIVAGNLLSSSSSSSSEVSSEEEQKGNVPFFLLDIYKVRSGGFPSSQVFFRSDLTYEEIGWDQQISIADGHVNYYTGDFGFVFYFCETELMTDDPLESTTALFMRRSEVSQPEGCWDTTLITTRQGLSHRDVDSSE